MAGITKAELEAKDQVIEEQEEKIKRLEEKMELLLAFDEDSIQPKPEKYVRDDNPGEDGGWLIETPNPGFTGLAQGIRFTFGYGFGCGRRKSSSNWCGDHRWYVFWNYFYIICCSNSVYIFSG